MLLTDIIDFAVGTTIGTLIGLIPLIGCIILEYVGPLERYSIKDRIPGILMNGVGMALSFALIAPLSDIWSNLDAAPEVTIPLWKWLEPLGVVGVTLQALILIIIADFLAYWRHRAEHLFFWRIHAVHHSPRELHAANSIGHPLQAVFSLVFIVIPMSFIQVSGAEAPVAVGVIMGMLAYYIHSPIDLNFGRLSKVVVDNRFHRIHHSMEERHFDKNFGICFSLWDFLFGTAYEPNGEWPSVGLIDTLPPSTVREYISHPFVASPSTGVEQPAHVVGVNSGTA